MYHLQYKLFVSMCNALADEVREHHFTTIYGVPRGGLVPAVYLSHLLTIPLTQEPGPPEETLIVDDIADSGQTLLPFYHKGYALATLFYHKRSVIEPQFWIFEKENEWIVFPWEKEHVNK